MSTLNKLIDKLVGSLDEKKLVPLVGEIKPELTDHLLTKIDGVPTSVKDLKYAAVDYIVKKSKGHGWFKKVIYWIRYLKLRRYLVKWLES